MELNEKHIFLQIQNFSLYYCIQQMFVDHRKKHLEWFVPKYMYAEFVSESEKNFGGYEFEKKFSDPQQWPDLLY
jgi:hypothetical protein